MLKFQVLWGNVAVFPDVSKERTGTSDMTTHPIRPEP